MYKKFSKWHKNWLEANCSSDQKSKCDYWLQASDTTNFDSDYNENKSAVTKNDPNDKSADQKLPEMTNVSSESTLKEVKVESSASIAFTSRKTLRRVTMESISCPPYRTYCKYRFQ